MLFPRPWYLAGLLGPWLSLLAAPLTLAQITPDATLGAEGSLVSPGVDVRGDVADLIEGGAVRGGNLFHSFLEFNVDEEQRVYFANPLGIESILSRVTGGNPSAIFGTLGVDGAADLFLINPNGLVFGENAKLDIQGSFYASTAEAISLGDGVYSATAPEQSSLLTVNPNALFSSYLSDTSGDIENRGQLTAGENLTLAADRLDLQGQVAAGVDLTLLGNTVQIRDAVDTPFVGFAGGDLLVQGNEQVDIVALSHADSGLYSYGDMVLRSGNPVGGDAHYWSGGNFQVENLDENLGDLFSPTDPIIRTFGDVEIGAYQGSSLHILAGGSVNVGTALITAPDPGVIGIDFLQEAITLSDVATVVAIDGGAQPTLDIRAGVAPAAIGTIPPGNISGLNTLSDFIVGSISAEQPLRADITVGDVLIAASNGLVLLTNQYQPNANLLGGNISVTGEGLFRQGINVGGFPEFGGQGGAVYLDARNNVALTNSFISTTGAGVVGDVVINASGAVLLDRGDRITTVSTNLAKGTEGTGGSIRIAATNVEVVNGALLQASTFGIGNAGNVLISAQERVAFRGTSSDGLFASAASSDVGVSAIGAGGNIEISAGTIEVTGGGTLLAGTLGTGDAGNVVIDAREHVVFDGTSTDGRSSSSSAFIRVESGAVGAGGNVVIRTGSLTVINGAQLQASTLGTGDAGNVMINARERVVFDGTGADAQFPSAAFTSVIAGAEGAGGNVNISTDTLEITNGAQLIASTEGTGDAGNVIVNARDRVIFDNGGLAVSRVETEGQGSGGSIVINTGNLAVTNGAQLIASTEGIGDAGNVIVNARDRVIFDGARADGAGFSSSASSGVAPGAEGAAGDVVINANSVYVTNTAGFSSETSGIGNAGDVIINALDQAVFANFGAAFSRVNTDAVGTGGNIIISADSLNVIDGSQLLANTLGNGNAGSIIINVRNLVNFDGSNTINGNEFISKATTSVGTGAEGSGGNIEIQANFVNVTNGAQLSTSTLGTGDAGNVVIKARDSVVFDGTSEDGKFLSGAFSSVDAGATGTGGDVQISANSLEATNGAQLSASTSGTGDAGNVMIEVQEQVLLNEGQIFVTSGSNSRAGQVEITADEVRLDRNSFLSAESAGVDGGNIILNLRNLLLLRNGSRITATAGVDQFSGNGGNITINAPFIVAIPAENSDITANAFQGSGGRIEITAQGVFGIEPRPNLTPLSDITASSALGVNGIVALNSLDTSFIQSSLSELPETLINSESLVATSCVARSQELGGTFTITGSNLPASPTDTTATVYPTGTVQSIYETINAGETHWQPGEAIVEPQGVYQLADGRLVASRSCDNNLFR